MAAITQNQLDLNNTGEQIVWSGTSAQLLNLKHYAIAVALSAAVVWLSLHFSNNTTLWAIIPVWLYAGYQYLVIKSGTYTITNQRLIRRVGVFNRSTFEIELYRIKDVHLYEPLSLRIFGLGSISLLSSQRSTQSFEIRAVKNAKDVREQLRYLVERRRAEKGVGEYDTN